MNNIIELIKRELTQLLRFNPSVKKWQLCMVLALCTGIPLFIGTYFGHFEYGVISSIGGMAALYMQRTPLIHRMVVLMCVSAGMSSSFFLGLLAAHFPYILVVSMMAISILVTVLCRFFSVPPPANFFFIMPAAIAAFIPHQIDQIPTMVGLTFLGSLFAAVLIFFYSLISLRINPETGDLPQIQKDFDIVIVDSVIIGIFAGLAVLIAQIIGLQKPYWVALSCLAVMQGMTFSAVWSRHLQRIVGTLLGLFLTWLLLSFNGNLWFYCVCLTILSFLVEYLIARNYGVATIFITPLTLFLAEYAQKNADPVLLMDARLYDTLLGAFIGLIAGLVIHSKRMKAPLRKLLHIVIPYRIF